MALYLALLLVLPVAALIARRLPLGDTLRMMLLWIAIFGTLFVIISLWQAATGMGAGLGKLPR